MNGNIEVSWKGIKGVRLRGIGGYKYGLRSMGNYGGDMGVGGGESRGG